MPVSSVYTAAAFTHTFFPQSWRERSFLLKLAAKVQIYWQASGLAGVLLVNMRFEV